MYYTRNIKKGTKVTKSLPNMNSQYGPSGSLSWLCLGKIFHPPKQTDWAYEQLKSKWSADKINSNHHSTTKSYPERPLANCL